MPVRKRQADTAPPPEAPALLDQLEDAVISTDLDGIIETWNPVAERLYGYTAAEAIGRSVGAIYAAGEVDFTLHAEALRAHGTHQFEMRARHKDGHELDIAVRLSLRRDAAGRPTGMIGCANDVTAGRSALRVLRRQQAELRVILDSMPALAWYKDRHNRILRANRAAAAAIGSTPAEMEGRSTWELYPQEADQYHRDDLEVIASGQPKLGIVEPMITASGERRWMRTDKVPYRDERGEIVGVIVFAVDITEQKHAEEALAQARDQLELRVEERTRALAEAIASLRTEIGQRQEVERRLELALWASDLAMWDWDARSGEAVCDPRWAEMLGYRLEEVPRPAVLWDALTHPDDCAAVQRAWQAHVVERRTPHYQIEHRLRAKDGDYRWVLTRGKVVERDGDGTALRMIGTNLDITARKTVEAQAARHQAELAHIQRLETVNFLAAELAHEINQPLGAIVNFANGLASRLRQGQFDPPGMLDAAEQIGRQAIRASTVLQRLRDFVRKDTQPVAPCAVNRLVESAAAFVEAEVRRYDVTLDLELADGLPAVIGDAVQIGQVVVNLLRNGLEAIVEAGGSGGGLRVVTAAVDGGVEVRVSDSGAGVLPAARERLFEPFFTTKSAGLGMGLSISRSIIDAHGGRLWLDDSGPPTAFCFTLPPAPLECGA